MTLNQRAKALRLFNCCNVWKDMYNGGGIDAWNKRNAFINFVILFCNLVGGLEYPYPEVSEYNPETKSDDSAIFFVTNKKERRKK